MAPHSSTLVWNIPQTEEPGRLQSMGSLDTTERLHFHFSLSCIGDGNGNPLQYSCLENPRDGGARWPAIYGVAQSQTRLKQASCSTETRRKAELVYRASRDMYGGCPWLRWATACISGWWCQKCPFFATGSWFTPYKVLLGCVLQLTKILNEKIKAKPSLNTFTLSEMFSESCLSSLEFLWANWGLYVGWHILSIPVLYVLGRGQRQWKLRGQEPWNKGERLAHSLSVSPTPDTNYNQFPLKVAHDPSSQAGTQSCSRCLLCYGGLPGHNEDLMSQEEDSFTEASSLWEEPCPTSSFCTFSSHNVSWSQQGLEKSSLSVTGQNTAKRFRTCNEAISWHPGLVTLG